MNFFEIDPHYFEKTYLLLPDKSEEAYSLLRTVMEKTAKAAIGRITLRSRERPVLVHYYRQAVVATTLRYPEEVLDPQSYQAIKDLPEPQEKELELAMEIIKSLSGELDLSAYHDQYKERIETLVRSKMAGTVGPGEEESQARRQEPHGGPAPDCGVAEIEYRQAHAGCIRPAFQLSRMDL